MRDILGRCAHFACGLGQWSARVVLDGAGKANFQYVRGGSAQPDYPDGHPQAHLRHAVKLKVRCRKSFQKGRRHPRIR